VLEVTVFRDGNHNSTTIPMEVKVPHASSLRPDYRRQLHLLPSLRRTPSSALCLPAIQELNEIKSTATYQSAVLFIEGQQPVA